MKRYLSVFLILVFLLISPIGAQAKGKKPDNLNLNCKSAVLMESSTGKIIYEMNSHEKLPPASVTKVMVMLMTMEAVDSGQYKLSDKVTCSPRAKSMGGSTMYLEAGEVRTIEELLKGVSIESANDGAVALGEFFGGSVEGFAEKMNARAKELGMNDTHFVNCWGFHDPDHYTSAYDLAVASRELLKHPKILEYTNIWMETITEGRKEPFTLVNRNKMIRSYPGCDGLKTGFVTESKYCIAATARRGDIRFISIVMGAPTWKERNEMAGRLMDYGFAKFDSIKVVKKGETIQEIRIPKSKPEQVKVFAKDDLSVIYEKGNKIKIEKKIEINNNIKLPLKKGDTVGVVMAVDGSNVHGKVDVVVECDVKKLGFGDMIGKTFKEWLKIK